MPGLLVAAFAAGVLTGGLLAWGGGRAFQRAYDAWAGWRAHVAMNRVMRGRAMQAVRTATGAVATAVLTAAVAAVVIVFATR